MATMTITIPDAQAVRVRDALCTYGGYQDTIDGQPNPVTRTQFSRLVLIGVMRDIVRSIERQAALATADATALPDLT